ncbi:MAG: hypothetical protein QGH83_13765, partial [Candidatus Pacebacteria bacterium]|nr:hypothetical protein [Candidatus Paceibacterota bacterium]
KIGLTHDIEAITRVSTTATIETTGPHGYDVNDEIEVRGVTSTGYNGVFNIIAVTDDTINITVSGSPSTPAVFTSGTAIVSSASPFDSSTRDVTVSSYKEMTVQTIYSGFASLQKNRKGLGASKKTATKYMWAQDAVSDSTPVRMDNIPYAYPNIIRRKVAEHGTDNVTAGSAGVYDSTMNYTTIQIGEHEINSHMTIDQFGGVQIDEIVRPTRVQVELATGAFGISDGDDIEYIMMEDGSHYAYEEDTPINTHVIPTEADRIWNVPPPSYIRGIKYTGATTTTGTGAGAAYYNTWDDNTKPPSFDDETKPPSFDAESGT